jgi:predicted Rossmann fold flavoprotein
MKIAIIGGGAAGCFCAIGLKRRLPDAEVTVYEAGPKLLAKVAVTGGGRCNLTNSFRAVRRLGEVYPRCEQLMRRALAAFNHEDTIRWFEAEGVRLVVQEDQCVFPESQDAMQIVRTLERCLREAGVRVRLNAPVERVGDLDADRVVVTVGGSSREKLERLLPAGVEVTPCVPSLFTLKIPDAGLRTLMGTVVERASLALAGTKFRAAGTLLLTDWGVSGPATLRLSSYAARHLAENGYAGTLLVNWLADTEARAREWVAATAGANPRKQAAGTPPEGLTARLWRHVLQRAGLREDLRWAELGVTGGFNLQAALSTGFVVAAGLTR